jgi:secondary thiamine-phosphate synthase enzyme
MVEHYTIKVGPFPRGFHLITSAIVEAVTDWPADGVMHVFIRHTSAGLSVNENADPSVRHDFALFFDRLAPEGLPGLTHKIEGPDDMPAHIKSALTGSTITVPILNGQPAFGTWQGIFLCEFRNHPRQRELIISIIS